MLHSMLARCPKRVNHQTSPTVLHDVFVLFGFHQMWCCALWPKTLVSSVVKTDDVKMQLRKPKLRCYVLFRENKLSFFYMMYIWLVWWEKSRCKPLKVKDYESQRVSVGLWQVTNGLVHQSYAVVIIWNLCGKTRKTHFFSTDQEIGCCDFCGFISARRKMHLTAVENKH